MKSLAQITVEYLLLLGGMVLLGAVVLATLAELNETTQNVLEFRAVEAYCGLLSRGDCGKVDPDGASEKLSASSCAYSAEKKKCTAAVSAGGGPPPVEELGAKPIGFFYFKEFTELPKEYVKDSPVRVAVEWELFEPRPGKFDFDPKTNKQAAKIQDVLEYDLRITPVFRARSPWASEPVVNPKCVSPPLDLDRKSPIKAGGSYSKTYDQFVKRIAEYYKGKFNVAVIENEINNPNCDWLGSVDDYLRLFLTAQNALKAVDPNVMVADGAIQSRPLAWLVYDQYIKDGNPQAAQNFLQKAFGKRANKELADRGEIEDRVSRAKEFLQSDLYKLVDMANFHYYLLSDGIPEVIEFLRKRIDKKPLMTDGIGIRKVYMPDVDGAAQEIVKKYARFLPGVSPTQWYTQPDDGSHIGALVDVDNNIVPETFNAFVAVNRFLNKNPKKTNDNSNNDLTRLSFEYADGTTEVVWSNTGKKFPVKVSSECKVFDHQNNLVPKPISQFYDVSSPVFIQCLGGSG